MPDNPRCDAMRIKFLLIAALFAVPSWAFAAPQFVEISARDVMLKATVFRPAGNGPFPAIVAMHGCDGLGEAARPIQSRYVEWGERLAAAGFATVFPDSFASRNLGSQCAVRDRTVRASKLRTLDANAARHWLQTQPWVIPDRVSLLGWSHGGATALWTIRRGNKPRADKTADFRSAVALYPNCRRSGASAWSARAPTLVLIGSLDDWTPASLCQQMVAGARGRSAAVSLVVYPGAYHEFDRANRPLYELTGIANTPNAAGRVHAGTHAAARDDAFKRVPEWFLR